MIPTNLPLKPTRKQLKNFLPDSRSLRAIEQLFEQAYSLIPLINSVKERINVLENAPDCCDEIDIWIASMESSMEEMKISALDSSNLIQNNLFTLDQMMMELDNDLNTLETDFSLLEVKFDSIETEIASLISPLTSSLTTAQNNISISQSSVSTLNISLTNLTTTVSTVQSNITTLTNNLNSLTTTVSSVQATLTTVQGNITALTNNLNALTTTVNTVQSSLATLTTTVTNLQTTVNGINTNLTGLQTNLDNHIAATVAHGATGAVVGTTNTQTLTNKTLTNPVINGFTGDTSIINVGSNQFYKDSSGNIGLGKVPSTKLDMVGIATIRGASATGAVATISADATNGTNGINVAAGFSSGSYGPIKLTTSNIEQFRVDASGNAYVVGAGILGYAVGTGGSVTQSGVKTSAVTLNKTNGRIIMGSGIMLVGSTVSFVLNNTKISATDVVIVNVAADATIGRYVSNISAVANGSCTISVTLNGLINLGEAIVLNFAVIKANNS